MLESLEAVQADCRHLSVLHGDGSLDRPVCPKKREVLKRNIIIFYPVFRIRIQLNPDPAKNLNPDPSYF